jgi:hypothetical protein
MEKAVKYRVALKSLSLDLLSTAMFTLSFLFRPFKKELLVAIRKEIYRPIKRKLGWTEADFR